MNDISLKTLLTTSGTSGSNARIQHIARVLLVMTVFSMPISTAATNVLMALTLLFWLAAGGHREQFEALKDNWVVRATVALFVLICVGSLYSTGPFKDIAFQIQKYARLLFIVPAMGLLLEEKWRDRAMAAFIAAMGLTLVLSLLSVVWPLPFVKGTAGGPSTNHYVFKDHIAQNLIMSFFALVMLVKGQAETRRRWRIAYFVAGLLAAIDILFFVQGRTGYLSLALNVLVFIVFMAKGRQRWMWLAASALVAILAFSLSSNMRSRIELAVQEYKASDRKELSSVGQRLEFTRISIELIKERPLFGFGTGSYATEFCRVAESKEWCEAGKFHPHNQFTSFGVQLGIIGIFFYITFMVAIAKKSAELPPESKAIGMGVLATLISDSLTHAPLFLVTEAQFFVLMIAINSLSPKPTAQMGCSK